MPDFRITHLTVDIFAVAHLEDGDFPARVIDVVHDPVLALTNAAAVIVPGKLLGVG
jgi:hypothetical protein